MITRKIGPVMQVAYLVADIDAAIAAWNRLGVGPFFLSRHIAYERQSHRGGATDCDISAAFAFSGDLQIELVCQHNDAPSAFSEFARGHGLGVHHLGVLSEDLAADTAALAEEGFAPFQSMVSTLGVETLFFDARLPGGTVLELIEATPLVAGGFAQMKAAAQAWSRAEPGVIEF